ncbi:MAG: flagellar basal body P-ring protein FlgI [Halarsenatibacteraceae bacterium]
MINRVKFKNYLSLLTFIMIFIMAFSLNAGAQEHDPIVEIGNITRIDGARDNHLIGYGIVVGLAGSGDSTRSRATVQSVANMLDSFGVEVNADQVRSRNIAAVIVTADLPHNANPGDQIDVNVNSMGDARSIQGGTLLMTPLEAGNGQVYAVAQGSVSIGGYNIRGGGQEIRENHPTAGQIPGGATVENNIDYQLESEELTLILDNSNFKTASDIAKAINNNFTSGVNFAKAENESRIRVEIPQDYENRVVDFIAEMNSLEVRPSMDAKVVINERTGTVVQGHNVRLSTVAVSHGNLSVMITTSTEVSQPESFTEGETVEVEETEIQVEEEEGQMMVVEGRSNVYDIVTALNAIGASPRDLVAIFQEIQAAGALHGELEIR